MVVKHLSICNIINGHQGERREQPNRQGEQFPASPRGSMIALSIKGIIVLMLVAMLGMTSESPAQIITACNYSFISLVGIIDLAHYE